MLYMYHSKPLHLSLGHMHKYMCTHRDAQKEVRRETDIVRRRQASKRGRDRKMYVERDGEEPDVTANLWRTTVSRHVQVHKK
jgi:hypothetical protein